ncbi:MAG TPA: metal/formaldehyde-sensitive transcriptional repressor [Candidatus Saccharimonadales bacterium]|jgi:DNA-binding FrmR family transcriptional regulator|nr:metal/formaldehyde-sensitive transcriptional repressor [Candidatus Saccharimonadales bacterium]
MAHIKESKGKLLARVRRIRGQVEAIEKALAEDHECGDTLQLIAATRGAMNGLMGEVVEGHIRHHVLSAKATPTEREGADELIDIVRSYLK